MKITDFEIFKTNQYKIFTNNNKEYLINKEPYLDVVLTDICNANCSFCIADLIHEKLNIDFEVLKEKVLFAIENMGVREVLLLGGEPTASPILVSVVKWLSSLKLLNKICMTTNGILLTKNDYKLLKDLISSGLTHLNISFMNINSKLQDEITNRKSINILNLKKIKDILESYKSSDRIKIRINNNIFKNNNDTLNDVIIFYDTIKDYCDSVKFSPLLKVDAFSVIDKKTDWVKNNILSDEEYDNLFNIIENYYSKLYNVSIIENDEQFGFVKNTMIPLDVPIILNYNQHGKMMKKVVDEKKINNIKLLPNGELSLSWNRELSEYFIKTDK